VIQEIAQFFGVTSQGTIDESERITAFSSLLYVFSYYCEPVAKLILIGLLTSGHVRRIRSAVYAKGMDKFNIVIKKNI